MPLRDAARGPARGGALALLACAATLAVREAPAQSQLSERAVVGQTVAGTTVRLEYARPVGRGRDSLFGRVVRWGERWTPGANWATTLETDRDVLVEGRRLAKGRYSVWAVPRPDRWTVTLHRRARRYHTDRPDSTDEALRLEVRPDSGAHTEVLTWDFPEVTRGGTTLRLRWGPVVVPLRLAAIPAPLPVLATPAARAPYLGTYAFELLEVPADVRPDTPRRWVVEVFAVGDTLRYRRADRPERPGAVLVPAGRHRFHHAGPGPDGQLWAEREVVYAFTVVRGRATGFEMQGDDGTVGARARRTPP